VGLAVYTGSIATTPGMPLVLQDEEHGLRVIAAGAPREGPLIAKDAMNRHNPGGSTLGIRMDEWAG
jgi:hypothetical protein